MARHRSQNSSGGRTILNVRLLVVTLVVLAAGGTAAFLVHQRQVRNNAVALRNRSEEATEKGDHAQAVQWLLQYIQLRPDDPEARRLLAQAVDRSAKTPVAKAQAIAHFNVAIGLFPGQTDLRLRKAELLLETGQDAEAVTEAAEVHSSASGADRSRANYVKALGLYRQLRQGKVGVSAEATTGALKTALDANPGHAELATALAELYREVSDPPRGAEADAVMDEMLKRPDPSAAHPSAAAYLARHRYRQAHRLPGADADLRKALELAPDDVEVLLAQGDSQLADKSYPAAVQTFERIVKNVAPNHRAGYIGLARAYAAMGDRPKALEVWRLGIENLGQGDVAFRLLLAQSLIEDVKDKPTEDNRRRVEESLKEVRTTLGRMAADLTENQYGRIVDALNTIEAEYWLAVKQPAKAAPLLAGVAETSRRSDNFREDQAEAFRRWWLLGEAYAAFQQWDLAAGAYQDAVRIKANSPEAELALAVSLHNAGRLPQALERYRRATQSPDVPREAWHLLAQAELQRQLRNRVHRDWTAFHRALQDAKSKLGPSPEVLLIEAEAAAAQGSGDEALNLLAKAVEADPSRILPMAILRYERWGHPERADASLADLRKSQGGSKPSADVVAIEAELLARRKQADAARRLLEKHLDGAQPAEAARFQAQIAELEVGLGDLDAARRRLRASHQALPSDPGPLQRLGDLAIQVRNLDDLKFCEQELKTLEGEDSTLWRFFQGVRLLLEHPEAGKRAAPVEGAASQPADEAFAQVIQHQEYLSRSRSTWPATHILTGLVAERRGRLDEAAASYIRATELGSQNLTLYERLFSLLYVQKRAEEAPQYLDRLQDSLYSSNLLWSVERTSLTKAGRFVELAESAQRAAQFRKDKISQVWLGHARTLAGLNEDDPNKRLEWYRKAEEAFREATSGDGKTDYRTWAGLVWHYAQRRQLAEATAALRQMEQQAKLDELNRNLALAQGYQMVGNLPEAARFYDEAVKLSPRNTDVLERQARFYFATNPAKAQEVFESLMALKPGETRYRFFLASLLATSGQEADFPKAMELLSNEAGGAPAQRVANRRLQAILLMQRGEKKDDTEAMRLLRELVDEANTPAAIDQLLLAQLYERQEKVPEAQRQYEYLVKVDAPQPAHLEAYLYFLLRHQMREEFQRQMKRLETLASEKNGLRVVRLKGQWYQQENRAGEIPLVVEEYRKTAMAQAKDKRQKAQVLGHVAALYDQYGLDERTEQAFQEVVEQQLVEHAYRPYAAWLGQKGRFADAIRLSLKHGATDASAANAALLANVVAAAKGRASPPKTGQEISEADLKATEERIDAMLKKEPNDRQLLFAVGALRHVQNRNAEAESLYRRVVAQRANDVAGLNNLALILSEQPENSDQALRCIHQALGQAPQSLELRDSLGLVLLNVGQADKAQEVLSHVVARRKSNRRYLFHLAAANYRLGDVEAARRTLSQAKRLSLAEEVLTPSERQLLTRLERDLDKPVTKGASID